MDTVKSLKQLSKLVYELKKLDYEDRGWFWRSKPKYPNKGKLEKDPASQKVWFKEYRYVRRGKGALPFEGEYEITYCWSDGYRYYPTTLVKKLEGRALKIAQQACAK